MAAAAAASVDDDMVSIASVDDSIASRIQAHWRRSNPRLSGSNEGWATIAQWNSEQQLPRLLELVREKYRTSAEVELRRQIEGIWREHAPEKVAAGSVTMDAYEDMAQLPQLLEKVQAKYSAQPPANPVARRVRFSESPTPKRKLATGPDGKPLSCLKGGRAAAAAAPAGPPDAGAGPAQDGPCRSKYRRRRYTLTASAPAEKEEEEQQVESEEEQPIWGGGDAPDVATEGWEAVGLEGFDAGEGVGGMVHVGELENMDEAEMGDMLQGIDFDPAVQSQWAGAAAVEGPESLSQQSLATLRSYGSSASQDSASCAISVSISLASSPFGGDLFADDPVCSQTVDPEGDGVRDPDACTQDSRVSSVEAGSSEEHAAPREAPAEKPKPKPKAEAKPDRWSPIVLDIGDEDDPRSTAPAAPAEEEKAKPEPEGIVLDLGPDDDESLYTINLPFKIKQRARVFHEWSPASKEVRRPTEVRAAAAAAAAAGGKSLWWDDKDGSGSEHAASQQPAPVPVAPPAAGFTLRRRRLSRGFSTTADMGVKSAAQGAEGAAPPDAAAVPLASSTAYRRRRRPGFSATELPAPARDGGPGDGAQRRSAAGEEGHGAQRHPAGEADGRTISQTPRRSLRSARTEGEPAPEEKRAVTAPRAGDGAQRRSAGEEGHGAHRNAAGEADGRGRGTTFQTPRRASLRSARTDGEPAPEEKRAAAGVTEKSSSAAQRVAAGEARRRGSVGTAGSPQRPAPEHRPKRGSDMSGSPQRPAPKQRRPNRPSDLSPDARSYPGGVSPQLDSARKRVRSPERRSLSAESPVKRSRAERAPPQLRPPSPAAGRGEPLAPAPDCTSSMDVDAPPGPAQRAPPRNRGSSGPAAAESTGRAKLRPGPCPAAGWGKPAAPADSESDTASSLDVGAPAGHAWRAPRHSHGSSNLRAGAAAEAESRDRAPPKLRPDPSPAGRSQSAAPAAECDSATSSLDIDATPGPAKAVPQRNHGGPDLRAGVAGRNRAHATEAGSTEHGVPVKLRSDTRPGAGGKSETAAGSGRGCVHKPGSGTDDRTAAKLREAVPQSKTERGKTGLKPGLFSKSPQAGMDKTEQQGRAQQRGKAAQSTQCRAGASLRDTPKSATSVPATVARRRGSRAPVKYNLLGMPLTSSSAKAK